MKKNCKTKVNLYEQIKHFQTQQKNVNYFKKCGLPILTIIANFKKISVKMIKVNKSQ